ncbi:hypothetical protein JCM11641_004213 [Rhodosporidiobolus odoratus]
MTFSSWPGYLTGDRWSRHTVPVDIDSPPRAVYKRRLGLLECKFDQATQRHGQSDTFVRLRVTLPSPANAEGEQEIEAYMARMVLAWATAREQHPLLSAAVHDAEGDSAVPGVRPREFRYAPPPGGDEALRNARETVLVHRVKRQELEEAMDGVQDRRILNGERVLLDQGSCLARLVLVRSDENPLQLGFFLVISHVISDGLSVFKLVNELFTLASSASLPTPPAPTAFRLLDDFLCPSTSLRLQPWQVSAAILRAWSIGRSDSDDLLSRLPLANEEHYPAIPVPPSTSLPPPTTATEVPPTAPQTRPSTTSHPSIPRKRWLWAIHRVLLGIRYQRYPRSLAIPRIAYPNPPVQAQNRWPQVRFSRETSSRLIALCKQEGISPSMLLYSLISLSVSNIFATGHPTAPYHPIILGFPFSFRPFLSREAVSAPSVSSSDPASDLAIRITFGQIHLPNLPLDPQNPNDATKIRQTAFRGARLAKEQFARKLAPDARSRSLFMAEAYSLVLKRLFSGAGKPPITYEEPKTALNPSMIGDVSRILSTTFPLPPSSPSSPSTPKREIRLSALLLGTRLHRGEGMLLEALTWDGMITLCLGVDDGLIARETVDRLLGGIREVGEVVAWGRVKSGEQLA